MKDTPEDPRQKAILEAAWTTFSLYGFRKTSMDDIARAAAISRPALYLHFRNKEDIFRSLIQFYYDETVAALGRALAGPGIPAEQLRAGFEAQSGKLMESVLMSPHGMELFDSTKQTSADIVAAGEAQIGQVYANWIAGLDLTGFSGTPQDLGDTITSALKGIKMTAGDFATYQAHQGHLAELIGAGLGARK